ncbi:MAG: hypothetical protein HYV93_18685 [Candidatus Rokubacteria bacterium]|nr:hypothetical protein [Candidatus Rokubacteria bacterium]
MGSLLARLVGVAVLWIAVALLAAGLILAHLFRAHVERTFDAGLRDHMAELVALADTDAAGRLRLKRPSVDPNFARPLSGWYWQITDSTGRIDRSRSLWDQELAVPAAGPSPRLVVLAGPRGQALRALVRAVDLPEAPAPFGFVVAGPQEEIEKAVHGLVSVLAVALVVLGLGLVGAVVGQVGVGLRPLRRLRRAVASVRAGRAARVDGAYPAEVAPLADEINALLAHDAEVVMRARTQAGDLAHALKTPLAVLANEAAGLPPERAALVRGQADLMRRHIDRHLSRARAAASRSVLGARCPVGPVGAALVRTLAALHRGRTIAITVDGLDGLVFGGDRHDLEEMLGNLLDNACKWGRTQVRAAGRLVARPDGDRLELTVEDDGPGIPEEALGEALVRGRRLDESVPGSGLGLAIVDDVAALYGGGVALRRSELGGLAAVLDLPAAG